MFLLKKIILSRFKQAEQLLPFLQKHIMGQDHILNNYVETVKQGWCHLTDTEKTRGNFFLLGPTGTGKTELIKQTANHFYGANNNLLRIDMSEYSKLAGDDIITKLIGSPGKDGGRLGLFLDQHDEGFILYDEIEKANPEFFTILLQQLDDARITLGNNKTYDLSKFYIVCTSNIGAHIFQNSKHLSAQHIKRSINATLKKRFSPEFIARFGQFETGILIYKQLETKHLRAITTKFLNHHIKRINAADHLNFRIKGYSEDVINKIIFGIDKKNGARDIHHIVKDIVQSCVYTSISKNLEIIESGKAAWLCKDLQENECHFVDEKITGKIYHGHVQH